MRHFICLFTILATSLVCLAQSQQPIVDIKHTDVFTLLEVYTENHKITIGGRPREEGDEFKASDQIAWGKKGNEYKNEVLCVQNNRTGEEFSFCAKELAGYTASDVLKYYIKKNKLAYKGSDSLVELMDSIMSDRQYMLNDRLTIKSRLPMEYGKGYMIRAIGNGDGNGYKEFFEVKCIRKTNEILITYEMLKEQGINIVKTPVRFSVVYWEDGEECHITDNMIIEYTPITYNRK